VDDSGLLRVIEAATAEAVRRSGDRVVCRPGCCECCLGPFDITREDAARLLEGLAQLDPARAAAIVSRAQRFRDGDDEPCPVLDPSAGTCELYAWRPVTCRVFGPPMRYGGANVSICALCFQGATDEEIAACAVDLDMEEPQTETTIAACLSSSEC
jgi:Fe-S-cluster containining protein